MGTYDQLHEANEALAAASDLAEQLRENGETSYAESARFSFAEAIALALLDVAVSQRVLAGRELN